MNDRTQVQNSVDVAKNNSLFTQSPGAIYKVWVERWWWWWGGGGTLFFGHTHHSAKTCLGRHREPWQYPPNLNGSLLATHHSCQDAGVELSKLGFVQNHWPQNPGVFFRAIALPVRQILKSFPPVPGIHSPFYREDRGMPVAWSLCFLERWLNFPRNGPNGVGRLQDGCSVSWVLREGPNQTSWDRVSGFT